MRLVGQQSYRGLEVDMTSERGKYLYDTVEKIEDNILTNGDFVNKLEIKIIRMRWEGWERDDSGFIEKKNYYYEEARINERIRTRARIGKHELRIELPEYVRDKISEKKQTGADVELLFKIKKFVTYKNNEIGLKKGIKSRVKEFISFGDYDWGINHRPVGKTIITDGEKIDLESDSDSEKSENDEDLTNNQDSHADTDQNPQQRPTQPAYVASVTDALITNAEQTSKASECNKYLNELRDTLKESDLEGETYDDILEELDTIIYRVESEGFSENLNNEIVQQIEDISHRIERLCQRQS